MVPYSFCLVLFSSNRVLFSSATKSQLRQSYATQQFFLLFFFLLFCHFFLCELPVAHRPLVFIPSEGLAAKSTTQSLRRGSVTAQTEVQMSELLIQNPVS